MDSPILFDEVPLTALDVGGYVHICSEVDTILRIEAQVYHRLVEVGRIEVMG